MKEMTERLGDGPRAAAAYPAAHEDYIARRDELGEVPEIAGVSAGGMPTRVKCLHVLVGHSLAAGPGVNPLGDEALAMLADWWRGTRARPTPETPRDVPTGAARMSDGIDLGSAAIDCGTNSIRLLVADVDPDAALVDLDRRMEIVRLGQGVDRPAARPRGAGAHPRRAREYAAHMQRARAPSGCASSPPRPPATPRTRTDFVAGVRERSATSASSPRSSTGDQEAELSFTGATGELAGDRRAAARTWSWTSAAARPSSCRGTDRRRGGALRRRRLRPA